MSAHITGQKFHRKLAVEGIRSTRSSSSAPMLRNQTVFQTGRCRNGFVAQNIPQPLPVTGPGTLPSQNQPTRSSVLHEATPERLVSKEGNYECGPPVSQTPLCCATTSMVNQSAALRKEPLVVQCSNGTSSLHEQGSDVVFLTVSTYIKHAWR